jgi:hypothetical protein
MGAGEKKSFGQFLMAVGLGEKKKPLTADQRRTMIEKANEIAERVLRMQRRRPVAKLKKKSSKSR